jgi:hypothetical protein
VRPLQGREALGLLPWVETHGYSRPATSWLQTKPSRAE